MERANIIQARLQEENSSLSKTQAAFQRNQRDQDPAAEARFEAMCADAMFRITILENRLSQHEEEVASRYAALDATLASDHRLAVLRN